MEEGKITLSDSTLCGLDQKIGRALRDGYKHEGTVFTEGLTEDKHSWYVQIMVKQEGV